MIDVIKKFYRVTVLTPFPTMQEIDAVYVQLAALINRDYEQDKKLYIEEEDTLCSNIVRIEDIPKLLGMKNEPKVTIEQL